MPPVWLIFLAWAFLIVPVIRAAEILFGIRVRRCRQNGLLFGAAVWNMSYVQLVPMGLHRPSWEYSPADLASNASHRLAYGAGVALGYSALTRR